MKIVALIPARGGSKRIPRKNIRPLAGVPLLQYTVTAAVDSGIFAEVRVCTEDYAIAEWCLENSPAMIVSRSEASATDDAADILWVRECVPACDAFAILRPTSPFRSADTIRRAFDLFQSADGDSIRAVEPVTHHPGKMWWSNGAGRPMTPVCDARRSDRTPWHSCPTQTLPPAYVQNASLEMAWTRVLHMDPPTISGTRIVPFFTEGHEGFDLNYEADWQEAERLISSGVSLPSVCPR